MQHFCDAFFYTMPCSRTRLHGWPDPEADGDHEEAFGGGTDDAAFNLSAEGNRLMNKRQSSGVIGCAYGCSNIGVSTTYKRAIPRMCTRPG